MNSIKKTLYFLALCALNNASYAQLDQKLKQLNAQLVNLSQALNPVAPKPASTPPAKPLPVPAPPSVSTPPAKPLPVPAPAPTSVPTPAAAWQQFITENKKHEQQATINNYPDFGVSIAVTADGKYQTLLNLQSTLQAANATCANFYKHSQLHMTLIYLHVPVEPGSYTDENKKSDEIHTFVINTMQKYLNVLRPLTFSFDKTEIIGAQKDFLVATYNPSQPITSFQHNFIMPFGADIFAQYPHAWLGYVEHPVLHISLGKLQAPCTSKDIKIPAALPAVSMYQLQKGNLKVSVKGPNTKPLYKMVPGW